MNPLRSDDKLPASFFAALYPELDAPAGACGAPPPDADAPRLARWIEHWPGGVLYFDTQLRCRLANRAARGWCLRPPAPNEPTPLHGLLPHDLEEALLPYLSAALRGLEFRFHGEFHHPTLGLRPLALHTQADHEEGHVGGVLLHLQEPAVAASAPSPSQASDVTAQRLRQLAEQLRDAAIVCLDPNGHITDWPGSAERLLGYPAEAVLGQPVQRFDAPAHLGPPPDTQQALERATFLGQYDATGWRVRQDGSAVWSQLVLTALHDPDSGEALGYGGLLRDMTEVKRLEDLLRQWNHELEVRVQERTQQLQDINQDLEAFSYSVSHDLRAPLRHIASFVGLLREDLGPDVGPPVDKSLRTIEEAAAHMGALIEGLLAFSRLGRAALTRRDVPMGAVVQSSLNRVQHDPTLQRPPEAVHWQLPSDWPTVQGDATLLSQVWDNLLSNALKYSRHRQPAQIALAWARNADNEWVFTVQDNGAGFDPKRAERLFGVFQRLHRASEFEGTGIGLALCRRIVERHGGRIWADSERGVGSRFCFALPASPQAAGPG